MRRGKRKEKHKQSKQKKSQRNLLIVLIHLYRYIRKCDEINSKATSTNRFRFWNHYTKIIELSRGVFVLLYVIFEKRKGTKLVSLSSVFIKHIWEQSTTFSSKKSKATTTTIVSIPTIQMRLKMNSIQNTYNWRK